jgi:hypothetical protein
MQVAIIADVKANAVDGGDAASGSWIDRVLNTKEGNQSIASLAANHFSLGEGRWKIKWRQPFNKTGHAQSRLFDVSNAAVVQYGNAVFSDNTVGSQVDSVGEAVVTLDRATAYAMQYQAETAEAVNGLGIAGSFTAPNRFTEVEVTQF